MTTITSEQAYERLRDRFARMQNLEDAVDILNWDARMSMPSGSDDDRTRQVMAISGAQHDIIADPETTDLLNRAEEGQAELESVDRRNLELMRRIWTHEAGLPADLAMSVAEVHSKGRQQHDGDGGFKETGDWGAAQGWYERSFALAREVGQAKMEQLGVNSPYEALVDRFSPGLTVEVIEREFAKLDAALRDIVPEAMERQRSLPKPKSLGGSARKWMKLNTRMAEIIGFDFTRGRFDQIKGHPFSCGSPDDNRITTKIEKEYPLGSLYATTHEAGHGLYNQGLPVMHRYQPVGAALGMAVHESQSHIMDEQACRSPAFLKLLAKEAHKIFKVKADNPRFSPENLARLSCTVQPSYIRIHADEITYPQHVMLRFELERAIIEGNLEVRDLPDAWWVGMQERLGLEPRGHGEGCMQDVHWPTGAQGYFPAYTLGSAIAAQLYVAAKKVNPGLEDAIEEGDFSLLVDWLRANVHSRGSIVSADQMLRDATGEPLNTGHYINSLSERYLGRSYEP